MPENYDGRIINLTEKFGSVMLCQNPTSKSFSALDIGNKSIVGENIPSAKVEKALAAIRKNNPAQAYRILTAEY